MNMTFDKEVYRIFSEVMVSGIAAGFMTGFIAWAIGYAVYGIIKFIKQS